MATKGGFGRNIFIQKPTLFSSNLNIVKRISEILVIVVTCGNLNPISTHFKSLLYNLCSILEFQRLLFS